MKCVTCLYALECRSELIDGLLRDWKDYGECFLFGRFAGAYQRGYEIGVSL